MNEQREQPLKFSWSVVDRQGTNLFLGYTECRVRLDPHLGITFLNPRPETTSSQSPEVLPRRRLPSQQGVAAHDRCVFVSQSR